MTIQDYLDKTKRKQYINKEVIDDLKMPEKLRTDLTFFKINRTITCKELEKEYEDRNLRPVDIASLCQYDTENPEKMDEMENVATQWKDANGNFCYADFDGYDDKHSVYVYRSDRDWDGSWWFAGVGKSSELEPVSLDLSTAIELVKSAGYKIIKEI